MRKKRSKKKDYSFLKKLKPTVSHLILYVFLGIYVYVAIFSSNKITQMYDQGYLDAANNALMGLYSFIGVSATVAIPFYFNKSKAENTIRENNVKYKMRFDMAKDVTKAYTKGEINAEGLNAMLALISDKDTSISVNGNGWGGSTVVEETTFNSTPFTAPIISAATQVVDSLTDDFDIITSEDGNEVTYG